MTLVAIGKFATSAGVKSRVAGRVVGSETPSGGEVIRSASRGIGPSLLSPGTSLEASQNDVETSSPQELVRELHTRSGLTWEQLAKLFGVSRRTLHFWASGGRMNAHNQELLTTLVVRIEELPGSMPADKRAALLQPREGGSSIYDELRASHGSKESDINRAPLAPHQMLGIGRSPRRD